MSLRWNASSYGRKDQDFNISYCSLWQDRSGHCWFVESLDVLLPKVFFVAAVVVVGVAGNLGLCLTIGLSPRLKARSINMFILNLCLSNILNLSVVAPLVTVDSATEFFVLGDFVCRTLGVAQITFFIAPMLTLLVISIDRYLAMKYPFREGKYTVRAVLICLAIWAVAVGVGMFQYFSKRLTVIHFSDISDIMCYDIWKSNSAGEVESNKSLWQQQQIYWFTVLCLVFFFPFSGMFFFYAGIFVRVQYMGQKMRRGNMYEERHKNNIKNVAMMVMSVILTTLICCLPTSLFWIIKFSKPLNYDYGEQKRRKTMDDTFWISAQFCVYVHGAIQPIIYFSTGSKLRLEAKRIIASIKYRIRPRERLQHVESIMFMGSRTTRSRRDSVCMSPDGKKGGDNLNVQTDIMRKAKRKTGKPPARLRRSSAPSCIGCTPPFEAESYPSCHVESQAASPPFATGQNVGSSPPVDRTTTSPLPPTQPAVLCQILAPLPDNSHRIRPATRALSMLPHDGQTARHVMQAEKNEPAKTDHRLKMKLEFDPQITIIDSMSPKTKRKHSKFRVFHIVP